MRDNEMGGTCGTYEEDERCVLGSVGGNIEERDYLKDLDVEWRIQLNCISKKSVGVTWTD
jgi:hypothetical protein